VKFWKSRCLILYPNYAIYGTNFSEIIPDFGFRKQPMDLPVRTNQIPRQVPEQPWFNNAALTIMVGGILPFGAVFVEVQYMYL
jgi:hypothetical protein